MSLRASAIIILSATLVLSACGGGGGGSSNSGGGGGSGGGSGGGGGGGAGSGGGSIPGGSGVDLTDFEGQSITMRAAQFQTGSAPQIVDATLTLSSATAGNGDIAINGEIEVFGETVTITNGTGTLANSKDVTIIVEPDRFGEFAAVFEAVVSGPGIAASDGEMAYVFGDDTASSTVAGLNASSVDYTGDFQAFGVYGGTPQTEYAGTATVTADFRGAGTVDVDLNGQIGSRDVDLEANNLSVSGNGFAGGLACSQGCSGTGSSQVDATFYGPNAEEIGGVLAIDINAGGNFDGAGSFVITNQ